MSEKLYSLLLLLYPAHFRRAYGEDALQLFRERLRDERGVARRLRLWFDLLADLAASAPREHRRAAVSVPIPAEARLFQVLETEPPRPSTFFFGGALALAGVAAFVILLNYGGERKPFRGEPSSHLANAQSTATGSSATQLSAGGWEQPAVPSASEAQANAPEAVFTIDAAERRRVIAAAIQNLRQYEEDREAARHIVAALLRNERSGAYDAMTSGRAFADALNGEMFRASPSTRVLVFYTNIPFTSINPSSTTHRIDDHFAISIPVGSSERRGRISSAMRKGARFS